VHVPFSAGILSTPAAAAPPGPIVAVVDGRIRIALAGSADAITEHSRRVALAHRRVIVGRRAEISRAPRRGRFRGYGFLDHLASADHEIEIAVEVSRFADGTRVRAGRALLL
jgi:hypothetical protein